MLCALKDGFVKTRYISKEIYRVFSFVDINAVFINKIG